MKNLLPVCTLLSICCFASKASERSIKKPPNILLILTDDQGYGDFGFYGNPLVKSPFLDRLAGESTRFNQFYACPVCTPTRAGLMTGRYAIHTGIYDTWNGGALMHAEEVTLAEILKDNGYATGIFGKWHLGDDFPLRPIDQGFDASLVHRGGGLGKLDFGDKFIFRDDSSYFNPTLLRNGKEVATKGYCSDVFTRAAIEFAEDICKAPNHKPFFIYLPFNAVHDPLQLPAEYLKLYKDSCKGDAGFNKTALIPGMTSNDAEKAEKVYGMVTNIDDNLRLLFDKLEGLGALQNTLVVFMTDNGPAAKRYTAGLRGRKASVYEGGIKVPSFWYWKGKIPENHEINDPAANIDVLPTLLDLCGLRTPADLSLDGKSLAPLIRGEAKSLPQRTIFFEFQRGIIEPYINVAVRKGAYKMVGNIEYTADPAGLELYNIDKDPGETTNISANYPDIVNELKQEFDVWYLDAIENKHLVNPARIIIGSEKENPVLLTREDWKSAYANPWLCSAFGYWDVTIEENGLYDVRVQFAEKPEKGGAIFLNAGTIKRTLKINDSISQRFFSMLPVPETFQVELPDVPLRKGDCMLKAWVEWKGQMHTPVYVEVEKIR